MKKIILPILLLCSTLLSAQTWSDDVAQITYNKCAQCHRPGGIAPFSLMNYSEVIVYANAMQAAITSGEMPPNPPDENYQSFVHSKALSPTEKSTILDWITNNTPEGNSANTPPPPVFSDGATLGDGDLQVRMPVYTSKAAANGDDYACFSVPSGLLQNRVIKAVEVIPGNRSIVHHALIYVDPTGLEITDSIGGDCNNPSNPQTKLITAYIPGSEPLVLPSSDPLKLGFSIPANSNIYFAMHYPDGSAGQQDSTLVIFHFYPEGETGIREVSADPVLENWNFSLPANQVTTVSAQTNIPAAYSIFSVLPHMHLLGKDIKSYGLNPAKDTIRFISIPEWDFHWQGFYIFNQLKHVPAGSTLHAIGSFDNTASNPDNPSSPPKIVYPGLNTKDEMFLVYFHYFAYEAGDENYDIGQLIKEASLNSLNRADKNWKVAPNPFDSQTTLSLERVEASDQVSVRVYNTQGQFIKDLHADASGKNFVWDGSNLNNAPAAKGLYYFSININGKFSHQAVVKHE